MESATKRSVDRIKKNFGRINIGISEISRTARYSFLAVSAAIAGSVYALVSAGDEIHKMSIRTGIAAKELSALGYAARISGADLDTVERSLRYLSAKMMDADEGLAEAKRSFDRLGISVKDVDGNLRPTIDVLKEAADKISAMTNETEKSALAGEIFGMRYGPMLLPLLEEGSAGITDLMNKAEELGITIDTSSAKAAAEFKDRLEDMKGALGGLTREIGEIFLPIFRNTVVVIIEKVKEWRKAIDALTPQQKKLIAQIVLLGTAALGAIGALGLFSTVAGVIKSAGLIIAGTFGLITSPLGLIMLAVGALALAWAYNWGDIQGKTKAAWDFLQPIFQGMWEALFGIEEKMKETSSTIEKETKKQASGWETAWKVIKTIGLSLKEIFLGARDIIIGVLDALGLKWEGFRWIFAAGLELLATDWGEFIEDWKAGIDIIKKWLDVKLKWTLEKVGPAWKWFTETLEPWLWAWSETTFYWLLDLAGTVWDKFKGIMQWVKEHAVFYFNWALIKIGDTWDWLEKTLWPWVKEWGTGVLEWSLKLIDDFVGWFRDTLIPWAEEFKEKTFKWILDLSGNIWDKIKEIVEWLGKIPEKLKPVKEGMQEVGEATKKMIPAKIIEGLGHLESVIKGQKVALEYASKEWGKYSQVAKRQVAATAATFILFKKGITDIAAKAPFEFSQEFQKGFMKATPKIQKAILDALTSGNLERAASLAGVDIAKAFLGKSPGMLTELESGRKDMAKTLDRMLGSMDEMTKKITVILKPIIGLFRIIFDAILKIIEKFSPEAAAEIKAFVDDTLAMMEGLFDSIEKGFEEIPPKADAPLKKTLSLWQKFCANLEENWKRVTGVFKAAFWDAVTGIIAGTQTITEAFKSLQAAVAVELAKIAVAAAKTGDYITAAIAGTAAAFTALGIRIRETTRHFETAWGTIGRSMAHTIMEMGENIRGFCDMLETEFNRVGLAISKTIEDAQHKLEGLYQSQIDLQKSTREQLISELDKYYDYRMLRELSLDELLALSAETRTKIEQGAIKEVSESEAEQEARRKDQAISRLQRIEDQYRREDELIRRKIALTEIEIKFLELKMEREEHGHSARARQLEAELDQMLKAYHEGVEAYEQAEKRKQIASGETAKAAEEANKAMADSTEEAAEDMTGALEEARRDVVATIEETTRDIVAAVERMAQDIVDAIEDMVEDIKEALEKIPEEIKFDVRGILHMPTITAPGPISFPIFGRYIAPHIPSAQVGIPYIPRTMPVVVHREEAILNPPQAREWRRGGESKSQSNTYNIRILHTGDIKTEYDKEQFLKEIADRVDQRIKRA